MKYMVKEDRRVQELSDRELRSYRREIRCRRDRRRKCLMTSLAVLATFCIVIAGAISYNAIHSNAGSGFKYYTGVTVESGETLWDLADEYIDYNYYRNKDKYISEVKRINHLNDEGEVYAGQFLVLPYYSSEYFR